jgi:plasmid stabilization system protein ParE
VRLFIQASAEDDILRQVEWYAERGLPDIAQRFSAAAREAIDALVALPGAGAPKCSDNPQLAGLRTWPVKGFDKFLVYYLARPELLTVVRILHGKRDIGAILESQEVEDPDQH